MNNAIRYQVMPPLSSEEYQELYESIKAEGIHEPIHVDEHGVVIDGHHRSKIASELDIPCPVITHDDLNESQKRSLAFTLNLKRRHLNREQRRALGLESLRLDPIASNREHAKRTGLSDKTIQSIRQDQGIPEPRGIIAEAVESSPEKSSREIARELGVGSRTVDRLRGAPNSETPNLAQVKEGPKHAAMVGANEEIPATRIISTKDLEELNALPTEQPTMEQPKPRAEPITSQFTSAIADLNKVMNRLHRITQDGNYSHNKEKVAALHRHDLNRTISELQTIADYLN